MQLQITQDPVADQVLSDDPFALLAGMMLDQQFPMERAFAGPAKMLDRFGTLDPAAIAAADPESFADALRDAAGDPPLPGRRWRRGCRRSPRIVVEERTTATPRASGPRRPPAPSCSRRVMALPGFGKQKAQIFVALLAKQLDVRPEGWEQAVGAYAEDGYRSVADVVDAASLQKVRDFKKAAKAARRPTPAERGLDRRVASAVRCQAPGVRRGRMTDAALDDTGLCRAHVPMASLDDPSDERCSCPRTRASCFPQRC